MDWLVSHPKIVFFILGSIAGVIACVIFACVKGGIFDDFD